MTYNVIVPDPSTFFYVICDIVTVTVTCVTVVMSYYNPKSKIENKIKIKIKK